MIMSEWKEVSLKDITELVIDYRGKTPLKLGGEWSNHGYRALSAKNVKTGIIVAEESIRYVNEDLYKKLILFRSHGITRDADLMTHEADGPWYYQQVDLGFNYRITDMQAALGWSQMDRLDEFVARRRYLVKRYNELLKDLPVRTPYQCEYADPSWHLYIVRVDFTKIGFSKKELFTRMKEKGIMLNLHYIPVHTQPYYHKLGFKAGNFPVSEKYYEEAFTLPLYYNFTEDQQIYVINCLDKIIRG